MLERLMEEFKRRTYVVLIFPKQARCLRLVRALGAEIHDGWIEADRYLDMSLLEEHKRERLRTVAGAARRVNGTEETSQAQSCCRT